MSRDSEVDPKRADAADGATSEEHLASGTDRTRRKLIKAGAVAVPLIVTLKALPAFAQTGGTDSLGTYGYDGGGGGTGISDPGDEGDWKPLTPRNSSRPRRRFNR